MIHPKHIHIHDYNYPLPDARIAKYPLPQRDASKLLTRAVDGSIAEDTFRHLPNYLPQGSLMVFNNTKVIQARLHFHKHTGALIEVFCLEPHAPVDYQQSFATRGSVEWTCLVGNLKKWKEGCLERTISVGDATGSRTVVLRAERRGTSGTGHIIRFFWDDPSLSWAEVLDAIGELPIPPYLNRQTEESDLRTYQTVYSKIKGSVAAPTAGLHFTPSVLRAIDDAGIERAELTLHVGAGTFKPVKSEEIEGHTMHAEWIAVPRSVVEKLLEHDAQCVAVGTTSVRTLESLYYIGKIIAEKEAAGMALSDITAEDLHVTQWMPYAEGIAETKDAETLCPEPLAPADALKAILRYLDAQQLGALATSTQIIIAPGYRFHIVRTIITNFHQPQSTLLLLVSAFVGGEWKPVYDFALEHDFRFLSYGDSSILNYDAISQPNTLHPANTVSTNPLPHPAIHHDNPSERLPVVDVEGTVTGSTTRGEAHSGTAGKPLHPVVHLHLFNPQGELFLQHRPAWKDIQPDKWDTGVGGHVDWGEDIATALAREAREEIGITVVSQAELLQKYVFESARERELVHVFRLISDVPPHPSSELDGGRFFSQQEILQRMGSGFFTPNFEQEYTRIFLK